MLRGEAYHSVGVWVDKELGSAWSWMHAHPRPCCTLEQLKELIAWGDVIGAQKDDCSSQCIVYEVLASDVPGTFSLGGDLKLFVDLIRAGNREALLHYAVTCCDFLYEFSTHTKRPESMSISLVQGDALGGGFEGALAADVLIAERGTLMGFPEIKFDLFPGMGALTFLSRRVGVDRAYRMILSGNRYTAEQLHDWGVVDILAIPGEGVETVNAFIRRDRRNRHGSLALRRAKNIHSPIDRTKLFAITELWVESALGLNERALSLMQRFVNSQDQKYRAIFDVDSLANAI